MQARRGSSVEADGVGGRTAFVPGSKRTTDVPPATSTRVESCAPAGRTPETPSWTGLRLVPNPGGVFARAQLGVARRVRVAAREHHR